MHWPKCDSRLTKQKKLILLNTDRGCHHKCLVLPQTHEHLLKGRLINFVRIIIGQMGVSYCFDRLSKVRLIYEPSCLIFHTKISTFYLVLSLARASDIFP